MFINRHICFNIVKNYSKFLKVIKNLKSYIIKLEKDEIIKTKVYLNICIVKS